MSETTPMDVSDFSRQYNTLSKLRDIVTEHVTLVNAMNAQLGLDSTVDEAHLGEYLSCLNKACYQLKRHIFLLEQTIE